MIVDGVVSSGTVPQAITFETGASSRTERLRIGSNGNVLINTTTDAGFKLDVNGTARVQGNAQFGTGFYWDNTNGRLGIGTSTPTSVVQIGSAYNATLLSGLTNPMVLSNLQAASLNYTLAVASNGVTDRGIFLGVRSRGTLSSPTAVSNGDEVFGIIGAGHDGTAPRTRGGIFFRVDGSVSLDNVPTAICFENGSNARTEKLRITPNGNVLINTTTDAGFRLDVNGTARVSTSLTTPIWAWSGTNVSQRIQTTQIGSVNNALINIENGQGGLNYSTGAVNSILAINNSLILQNQAFASCFTINPTYNFSGNVTSGAIMRGIYYNPTLTNIGTAQHFAFHSTSGRIRFENLPTSPTGLSTGEVWNNLGILTIV
jgi:hypothetical protein